MWDCCAAAVPCPLAPTTPLPFLPSPSHTRRALDPPSHTALSCTRYRAGDAHTTHTHERAVWFAAAACSLSTMTPGTPQLTQADARRPFVNWRYLPGRPFLVHGTGQWALATSRCQSTAACEQTNRTGPPPPPLVTQCLSRATYPELLLRWCKLLWQQPPPLGELALAHHGYSWTVGSTTRAWRCVALRLFPLLAGLGIL